MRGWARSIVFAGLCGCSIAAVAQQRPSPFFSNTIPARASANVWQVIAPSHAFPCFRRVQLRQRSQ